MRNGGSLFSAWPEVVQASSSVDDYERSSVMAFLSGKQNPFGDYSSQSGEIVGILKVRTACVCFWAGFRMGLSKGCPARARCGDPRRILAGSSAKRRL